MSFLFTAPYADLWTTIHKTISFLACIWHISAPGLAFTSHVVNFIHCNTCTCSPDLCLRATSVYVPLPHQLASLCRNLSHACIGMFESLILCPYCVDDLWTYVHRPDMGHRLCHRNRLTALEFCLTSFLTPKNNEKIAERSYFLSRSLKYRKGHLHCLIYLLFWTM